MAPTTANQAPLQSLEYILTLDNLVIRMGKCVRIYSCTTRTLSHDGNAIGIAPKLSDVRMDPLNGSIDVEEAKVLCFASPVKLRNIRLAEDVETIVESDKGYVVIVTDH
jgi:predicted transcriptional regulator